MVKLELYSIFDTRQETINLTGNSAYLIRGHSTAEIIVKTEGVINLDTFIITNGSASEYGVYMEDTMPGCFRAEFENVQTDTFSISCEDDAGNYFRKDVDTNNLIDYIDLTCNFVESRPDANGNMLLYCFGNYFNDSFGRLQNTLAVQYRYRIAGGSWSSYNSMTVGITGDEYTAQANITALDYEETYEFEFRAADRLMTVVAGRNGVTTLPVFHWSGYDFAFEVPVDFKRKSVSGLNISDYLGFSGSTSMIASRSSAELEIYAPILNLSYGILKQNGNPVVGTWTPDLGCPRKSTSTYTAEGWYSRCGNVVTVGFFLKWDCEPGYHNTDIKIYNLPFTPATSAAGSGMCSGAYVSAGFNFQCFVAETSGLITTRVQACNNTSAGNLATSASGCKYPINGGVLTLSGTITYKVKDGE